MAESGKMEWKIGIGVQNWPLERAEMKIQKPPDGFEPPTSPLFSTRC